MIIKIMNDGKVQYKETHHQVYVYSNEQYLEEFPNRQDRNLAQNAKDDLSPEAVIVYNYIDGGGGHLHVFKGTRVYLMNNDGKTVDKYCYH